MLWHYRLEHLFIPCLQKLQSTNNEIKIKVLVDTFSLFVFSPSNIELLFHHMLLLQQIVLNYCMWTLGPSKTQTIYGGNIFVL